MSRHVGFDASPILRAATLWRERALLNRQSIFTDQFIWSPEVMNGFNKSFVQQPDDGAGKFFDKLQQQLSQASPEVKQLAAEMMWIMYLCPSSLTVEHKRRTIETIWSWSNHEKPNSDLLSTSVLKGIGSAGPGFNQNQWRELIFAYNFVTRFQNLNSDYQRQLLSDAWAFDEWLKNVPDWEARQLRHMILFLMFPDTFERIFGQIDRKTIVRHFSQKDRREINRLDPLQLDRELQTIRSRLESEHDTTQLDFYLTPLKDQWGRETIKAAIENVNAEHIRKALSEIDKEGISEGAESTAYDLVDENKTYPPKLVLALAVKYATGEPLDRANFKGGDDSVAFRFFRKLGFQIIPKPSAHDLENLIIQFIAQAKAGNDLQVQRYLKSYRGLKVKVSFGQGNFARIPWIAFLGEEQSVSQGIYPVLLYFREFNQLLACFGVSETSAPTLSWGSIQAPTVREWFTKNLRRSPDRYGSSYVAASFEVASAINTQSLENEVDQLIDQYRSIIETPVSVTEKQKTAINSNITAAASAFSDALVNAGVNFGIDHESLISSFVASVLTKPLVILTGLSGSGKTQIALRFGEWIGPDRLHVAAVRPDWTSAEALFGYEDGLKPSMGGKAAWSVPPALAFMLKAAKDTENPYLLLLDEMNLAHVERYFADVLSGMESAQPCLPNLMCGNDGLWRIPTHQPDRIPLPKNLWVVGTVNVDETTYMFSPKVLDRANTFEFRVKHADLLADSRKPQPCAVGDQALVRGLLAIAKDDDWHTTNASPFHAEVAEKLKQVHQVLSRFNLEFGHRVYFEALRFAAIAAEIGTIELNEVLDRIVLQKILPKLHGSRRRLEIPLLAMAQFCAELPDVVDSNERLLSLNVENQTLDAKLRLSYEKIIRMLNSLRINQFVSFTE